MFGRGGFGSTRNLRAQSNSPRGPAVVELYTSQGCSSCPPADALLGELSQMPNVLALAFHVDYWDSIGWRDHFALPTAVQRQYRYVEILGLSSAFTPQAVVDGRSSFVGSDRRRILAAIAEPLNTISGQRRSRSREYSPSPCRNGRIASDTTSTSSLTCRRRLPTWVAARTPEGRSENSTSSGNSARSAFGTDERVCFERRWIRSPLTPLVLLSCSSERN